MFGLIQNWNMFHIFIIIKTDLDIFFLMKKKLKQNY